MNVDSDYELIPMGDIEDEAREIAVRWTAELGCDWIGNRHKLASDIMNYARRQVEKSGRDLNRPIRIDGKDGVITMIDTLPTGITLVYIDFERPNPHWKIYTMDEVIRAVGSREAQLSAPMALPERYR